MPTGTTSFDRQLNIIAAWIMTHPHSDHFHRFITFMDHFADDVTVEKYMFTFPEHDDTEHYPKLAHKDPRFEDYRHPEDA